MFVIDHAFPREDERDVERQGDKILHGRNSLGALRRRIPAAARWIRACNTRVSGARERRICMPISFKRINPYVWGKKSSLNW